MLRWQTSSPMNANYCVTGFFLCFPISKSIVSLNFEPFSHLVTLKICWLKEHCSLSWMLVLPKALRVSSHSASPRRIELYLRGFGFVNYLNITAAQTRPITSQQHLPNPKVSVVKEHTSAPAEIISLT